MRKLSFIRVASTPGTNCSRSHKSVRNRTEKVQEVVRIATRESMNPMKLPWPAPLATRMLIL
jgi:hypothetical protein